MDKVKLFALITTWELKAAKEYEASLRATTEGGRNRLGGRSGAYNICAAELRNSIALDQEKQVGS